MTNMPRWPLLALMSTLALASCGGSGGGSNSAPVAVVEVVAATATGAVVLADGGSSTDPDGDRLSYRWTLETPTGSSTQLNATNTTTVSFTPDTAGAYTLSLTVSDAALDSARVSAAVTALGPPPPTGVTASADNGDGTVTVDWQPVGDATRYVLYWSPGTTVTAGTGNRIDPVTAPFVHDGRLDDVTYTYAVVAVNDEGESAPSSPASATPRAPIVSGTTALPALSLNYTNGLNAGGLIRVCIYTLSWQPACDTAVEPNCHCDVIRDTDSNVVPTADRAFAVSAPRDAAYILVANYAGGQGIAAFTPTVAADTTQDISLDTELAMNVIALTASEVDGQDLLDLSFLAPSLESLLGQAQQAVANVSAHLADPNLNRNADRTVVALRNLTLDRLNRGSAILIDSDNPNDAVLNGLSLRAYGGGLGSVRSLASMLSNPLAPLNPGLSFNRVKQASSLSTTIALSDLNTSRWDYLATNAISPHISVGGDKIVYIGVDTGSPCTNCNAGGYPIQGVYIKTLGQDNEQRLTPPNLFALTPKISPDQTQIAFGAVTVDLGDTTPPALDQPAQIYVMDSDGQNLQPLTSDTQYPADPGNWGLSVYGNLAPDWSPGGDWLAFQRLTFDGGNGDQPISQIVRLRPNDPAGQRQRSTLVDFSNTGISYLGQPRWAPGGDTLFFSGVPSEAEQDSELFGVRLESGAITRLTSNAVQDLWPAVSYDGRFVVHLEVDAGNAAINVRDRYNGSLVTTLGDFAAADEYGSLSFTGTDAVLRAVAGAATDGAGTVLITPPDARLVDDPARYSYYEEVIPDAGTLGVDYSLPDWY